MYSDHKSFPNIAGNKENAPNLSSYHDMRAPPRRRVKGDEVDEQPIFLRKAFNIISNCPPEIGGWSEEGDAVIIKDVKEFSEKVIPTAYRHNNFSSFVRQLNFYGFRKVKSNSLNQSEWWVFRHPQFLRDRPHLLSEIKRSVHFVDDSTGSGKKEVTDMKMQIDYLTDKLNALHDQVDQLTSSMANLQTTEPSSSSSPLPADNNASMKKRKLVRATSNGIPSLERGTSKFDFDYFMNLEAQAISPSTNNILDDQDLNLEELENFAMDGTSPRTQVFIKEEPISKPSTASQPTTQSPPIQSANNEANPASIMQDIPQILAILTPELKARFVDRLAETMGKQLVSTYLSNNIPLATATPCNDIFPFSSQNSNSNKASSQFSKNNNNNNNFSSDPSNFLLPSGSKAPEIALPLATAALTAFIMSNISGLQNTVASVDQSRSSAAAV